MGTGSENAEGISSISDGRVTPSFIHFIFFYNRKINKYLVPIYRCFLIYFYLDAKSKEEPIAVPEISLTPEHLNVILEPADAK
jgi:hypothetical protein